MASAISSGGTCSGMLFAQSPKRSRGSWRPFAALRANSAVAIRSVVVVRIDFANGVGMIRVVGVVVGHPGGLRGGGWCRVGHGSRRRLRRIFHQRSTLCAYLGSVDAVHWISFIHFRWSLGIWQQFQTKVSGQTPLHSRKRGFSIISFWGGDHDGTTSIKHTPGFPRGFIG